MPAPGAGMVRHEEAAALRLGVLSGKTTCADLVSYPVSTRARVEPREPTQSWHPLPGARSRSGTLSPDRDDSPGGVNAGRENRKEPSWARWY
ncbi:hypothetical protein GCM10027521_11550 [Amycolatopsis cihanbeyliensis]